MKGLARNESPGSTASATKICSRFALSAGETPAVPVGSGLQLPTQTYRGTRYRLDRSVLLDCAGAPSKLILYAVGAFFAILSFGFAHTSNWSADSYMPTSQMVDDDLLDKELSLAATAALGEREGTVIVMDPRTGRVRVVVNPQVAFATTLAPGSTIKPFTTLAGLRTGLIGKERRMVCREHFTTGDFATDCSHPTGLPSLGATEAIAYSCNYYFGKLGEQLRESSFDSTLAEFGFGEPTGINWAEGREAAGKLPHGSWRAQNALGESDQIQVTPIQLLTAYSALVNGQQLLVPRIAPEKDFVAQPRADIAISDKQRQLIVDGMRGAVRYGTAERARLHSLPLYIFGKTGTSTETAGFRTHGWFVGFASEPTTSSLHNPSASKNIRLAVLVFLKRGRGVDAAELARPIFEQFSRGVQNGDGESGRPADTNELEAVVSLNLPDTVSLPTGTLPLEDYVLGVVAAEGSTETEPEALKALAVAARTYALKNLRRHGDHNYDFCTLTHCQRYRAVDAASADTQTALAILVAVRQTSGEVLREAAGAIVESYFSASCGGATANISTLWNAKSLPYLTGEQDQFCLTEPHHAWTDVISSADLLRALNSDPRTEVGDRLTSIVIRKSDASGRAQTIAIRGDRSRTVSGWDFKIIIGRTLGWNLLKSSRFEIARSGTNYVFQGSGFGHGLGLCQEGAHVMARRGAGYQQILAKYFPGTRVSLEKRQSVIAALPPPVRKGSAFPTRPPSTVTPRLSLGAESLNELDGKAKPYRKESGLAAKSRQPAPLNADLLWNNQLDRQAAAIVHAYRGSTSARRTLSSEHFRISYPESVTERDAEYVSRILESTRNDLIRRVSAAGISLRFPALEIFINQTTGDFVGRTGQPPWAAAATRGNRVELQPLALLKRRRILETTLRHELVHSAIDTIGRGHTPRWLAEGLALYVAGEGPMLKPYLVNAGTSVEGLERRLSQPTSPDDMRAAYAAAYREVKRLITLEGEATVWRRITLAG